MFHKVKHVGKSENIMNKLTKKREGQFLRILTRADKKYIGQWIRNVHIINTPADQNNVLKLHNISATY